MLGELKEALAERMLNAEMDVHLEQLGEAGTGNHRNGSSPKTVLTPEGEFTLSIPRDRHGRFDPALIAEYRRRFPGFDDKIIAPSFVFSARALEVAVLPTPSSRRTSPSSCRRSVLKSRASGKAPSSFPGSGFLQHRKGLLFRKLHPLHRLLLMGQTLLADGTKAGLQVVMT